jgi:hypothetical protein
MCGLVGLIYRNQNGMFASNISMFEDMLHMDALRGEDSVGIAALYNNGEARLVKEALVPVQYFINGKEWQEVRTDLLKNGKAVIGHNRKATKGTIKDETAHPWLIDNRYLFMHNGTLYNHKSLHDTEVDSEALGMSLVRCNGDPKAIEEVLSSVQGAYACIWIDQEKEKVYAVRNSERPLYLAKTLTEYILCSESGFIYAACSRNTNKIDEIKILDTHTLYEWDVGKYTDSYTETKLEIKKAMPTIRTSKKSGQKSTAGANTDTIDGVWWDEVPSKNSAKRFRKKFKGQPIYFWVDTCYPSALLGMQNGQYSRFIIKGESDVIDTHHEIKGFIDGLPKGGLKTRLVRAIVEDADYDQIYDKLDIQVVDVTIHQYPNMEAISEIAAAKH